MLTTVEKNLIWIGGVSSLLALGGAFETFTTLGLFWRLLITALAGLSVAMAAAGYISGWVKQDHDIRGFGREEEPRSNGRFAAAAAVLAVVCAIFAWLAWFQTDRFVLKIGESRSGEALTTLLHAPLRPVSSMTVQLPGPPKNDCNWRDRRPDSYPRLAVEIIDWDTPIRKLRVDNFVYPQTIAIECRPPANVSGGVHVEPPSTEVFLAGQLRLWQRVTLGLGGLIWIAAVWRLFSLSR